MARKTKFKQGDIVQLKSGGPKMTVSDPDSGLTGNIIRVDCQWFSGAKLNRGSFAEDVLEAVDLSPKGAAKA